jgi:hypothetical protein
MPQPLAAMFGTAGFAVAGAALMAVPIIIHLLNRRRFRTVLWAAMEYLLQALRKNRRRLRFEQWVLLATRCALLGLLGLALARPTGCEDNPMGVGRSAALHVIVIDTGYSMAYDANRPGAKTHLDQAKLIARKVLDNIEKGGNEAVAIVATCALDPNDPRKPLKAASLFGKPSYEMDSARLAVDRLEQGYGASDITGALDLAMSIANEAEKLPRKLLYVITDATQADWGDKNPRADYLRGQGAQLAKVFGRPMFFNLGKPDQWNFALLDLSPEASLVTTKFDAEYRAALKAFGPGGSTQIQWSVDGKPDASQSGLSKTTLNEKSPPTVLYRAKIEQGGVHVLGVELQNDEKLKIDNTRWRVVEVASELKVLIVEGERGVEALSSSGAFLELALAPPRDLVTGGLPTPGSPTSSATYVTAELVTDDQLPHKDMSEYRAVILTNVGFVSEQQADRLQKFVREGGTLMLFMGPLVKNAGNNVDPRQHPYNRILAKRGLLPGELTMVKSVANVENARSFNFDFNPKGNLHPFLRTFRDEDQTGLDTARVDTYYQCQLSQELQPEVVLAYASDQPTKDPAITVHRLEKGRVVWVSTTANCDWTYLPAKPAYPTLMHELLQGSVNLGDRWLNLEVGQSVEVPPLLRLSQVPKLVAPNQRELSVETVALPDGLVLYRSNPLTRPGIYKLLAGLRSYSIAVNVPAEEADIRVLKDSQVRRALGDIDVDVKADVIPAQIQSGEEQNDFSWALMLVVLGLAGAECFMAMKFGHYRKQSTVVQPQGAAAATQPA